MSFYLSIYLFLIFLVIPWFELLCHISPLRLSSGHSSPVLTVGTDNVACASAPSPHWLLTDISICASPLLIVAVRHVVCGCFFFFGGGLCCPLRFQSSPLTCLWEGFLSCGNFSSFMTPSPGQVSIPKYFVSVFILYILSYLLPKRLGCLSGYLVSSDSILFCGSCSTFKWSFDEIVGEKVVSPS